MSPRTGLIALAMILPALAHAEDEADDIDTTGKTIRAVRTAQPPVIDGRLDDAVWAQATPDDGFLQNQPEHGHPPTERTEVRVLFDDTHLYIAARCYDDEPGRIAARLTRRDRDIEADWLVVGIDSRHDHRTARWFQLSAAGVQVDGEAYNDGDYSSDWDGVWQGTSTVDEGGWSAEWAIPFSMLRFPDVPEQTWGIQFLRGVSRKQEQMGWVTWPQRLQGDVSHYGTLVGISGIRPHRTFELRPYIVGRLRSRAADGAAPFGGDLASSADLGLDAKIGLTSSLTLDATINPDFGQVEADQVVLNLTNFETFFPEKRPFFLEGRDVFESPATLFYPRRIGRPPVEVAPGSEIVSRAGEPVVVKESSGALPIWIAAKVTGKVGERLSLGIVEALTGAQTVDAVGAAGGSEEVELAPARSYGVLRAKLDVARGASIGLFATAVNRLGGDIYRAAANHDAYTQAIDGWWQSPGNSWRLLGQAAISERVGGSRLRAPDGRPCPDEAGDPTCLPILRADGTRLEPGDVGAGATAKLIFSGETRSFDAAYSVVSRKIDLNDIGFLPEFNSHMLAANIGFLTRRPSGPFLRTSVTPGVEGALSFDGRAVQKARLNLASDLGLKIHWLLSPRLSFELPRTYNDFETFDGAHFEKPAILDAGLKMATDKSRPISVALDGNVVRDLNGDGYAVNAGGSIAWQARSNLELSLDPGFGYEQNAVRWFQCTTDGGADCAEEQGTRHYVFADLDSRFLSFTLRGTYTFIPTLSLQAYAQLFLAKGDYSRFRAVDTEGAGPFIRRDDLRDSSFTADAGFATTSLNVNLVMRWELLPGSALFAVYTRGQEAPRFGVGRLGGGASEDVLLLKLVYFASG